MNREMYSESVPKLFDPSRTETSAESECSFWSRPDGRVFLQVFRPSQSVSYAPHTHSEYNLVVCLEGAVHKMQMGNTQVIEAGEAMMGNFGVEHASVYETGTRGCESVCLTVDRRVLGRLIGEINLSPEEGLPVPVFLGRLASDVIRDCARDVVTEMREQRPGYDMVLEGLAIRMLVEALRIWPSSRMERCDVDWTPRLPRRDFVRAYEFMRWCRKDQFRLQHLARFLGSSEERFTRLFRTSANESPAVFFNRLLLRRGSDLLRDRSLSVKEISYQLGFKTSSHFVMAFRREFGATPQDYRLRVDG